MKTNLNKFVSCFSYSMVLLLIVGCGVLVGNPKADEDDSEEGSDVTVAGNYTMEDTGSNLTADTYDIMCATQSEPPQSCVIPLELSGGNASFDKKCGDFSGIPFNCFVRRNEVTLSGVKFDQGTTLVTSGGKLNANIDYDLFLGYSGAGIDKEKTTAKIKEPKLSGVNLPSFEGKWELECVEDLELGLGCDGDIGNGFQVNMHELDAGDQKYASIWWEDEKRDICIAENGNEARPDFFLEWSGTKYAFDFTSAEKFITSVDVYFAAMPEEVRDEIQSHSDARISDDIAKCASGSSDTSWLPPGSCDKVSSGVYKGLYQIQANENRGTVGKFAKTNIDEIKGYCDNAITDSFKFSDCDGADAPYVCGNLDFYEELMGITLNNSSNIYEAKSDFGPSYFWEDSVAQAICPDVADDWKAKIAADEDVVVSTYITNCHSEFFTAKTTAPAQAESFSVLANRWLPSAVAVACSRDEGDTIRKNVFAAIENSCSPEVNYEPRCTKGGVCNLQMTCSGGRDGICYDENDVYIGAIMGREGMMRVNSSTADNFELENLFKHSWLSWDSDSQETIECHYVERQVVNAKTNSKDQFSGIYTTSRGEHCEGDGADPYAGGDHHRVVFSKIK
jgi:hypothetical protein